MIDVEVTLSGPLFNGQAVRAVDDFIQAAEEQVADVGVNRVKARLGGVLKNPTGYYESRIVTDRQADDSQVSDSQVVYGPWLEGVGSRNATTRFKGYRTFRLTSQDLQRDANGIAAQVLDQYIGRMG